MKFEIDKDPKTKRNILVHPITREPFFEIIKGNYGKNKYHAVWHPYQNDVRPGISKSREFGDTTIGPREDAPSASMAATKVFRRAQEQNFKDHIRTEISPEKETFKRKTFAGSEWEDSFHKHHDFYDNHTGEHIMRVTHHRNAETDHMNSTMHLNDDYMAKHNIGAEHIEKIKSSHWSPNYYNDYQGHKIATEIQKLKT